MVVDIIWIVGEMIVNEIYLVREIVFTKNHITGNAYARINCTSPIDIVENF